MVKVWLVRLIEAVAITVTLTAVCQELEKPKEERQWYGRVGFIPYDFRIPTIERIKEAYWNPDNAKIFMPEVWGIGWAVNIHAVLEKMRLIGESYYSEEDFLMPTRTLRKALESRALVE